jgi:hypothetical protein
MSTIYTHESYNYAPVFPRPDAHLYFEQVARTYILNDNILGARPSKGTKITNAWIACESLESAGPTLTLKLRLNNGTSQQDLVTVTAAQAAAGAVVYMNVVGGANYVIPDNTYYLEVLITANAATPASGKVKAGATITNRLWGLEQP